MSRIFYPALFHPETVGYSVTVPDLDGCFSEGDTLEQAYENTLDAIGLYLSDLADNKQPFPSASMPDCIQVQEGDFVVLASFDMLEYKKKHNNRSVKKTLTIPAWMDEAAQEKHINFSSVLQHALLEQIEK